ncbi:MAG: regulatory protein RecX [Desulfobulbaceae bacterium]|nr:regulatory protein RecX [Desulfobulbaceae bacterium]
MSDERFSNPVEARKKAMDYLARREHGRVELRKKLIKFGFDADTSDNAIERLIDDGLQSDQRFAEAFIQSRINQGKGPTRIRADLSQRGVRDSVIDDGLYEAGQNWRALARDVREKKFGVTLPVDFKEKARQMRFLQYRGFEPDHIQSAVSAGDE